MNIFTYMIPKILLEYVLDYLEIILNLTTSQKWKLNLQHN